MEFAALIISIAALFVAGASAWYTRGQKAATTELAAIERARRADEEAAAEGTAVDFRLIPHGISPQDRFHYTLVNGGRQAAYGVRVQLKPGADSGPKYFKTFLPSPESNARYHMPHRRPMTITWHQLPDCVDPPRTMEIRPPG